jgi:hypothetical protein
MAIIVLVSALTMLTLNIQQTFAMTSTGQSGVGGGSTGATIGAGSTGQSGDGGGSTGATIGTGSVGQSVDHHLFCNTGMITPICK